MKVAEWVLMVLTFGVLLYPLGVQALAAVLFIILYPFVTVSTGVTLSGFIFLLTALGCLLGFAGLVMSICRIKNKITLFFLISGLLAYYYLIFGLELLYGSYERSLINSLKSSSLQEYLAVLWFHLPFFVAIGYSLLIVINLVKIKRGQINIT